MSIEKLDFHAVIQEKKPSKKRTPRTAKIYTTKTIDTRSHAFNVGIATDYSPDMAIWLGHLSFWTEKNLAHEKHIHDGRVWCYDTLDTLSEYFPYYSQRQLETIINNSVKEGLVIKGNYNQTEYDRTCWYALNPKAYFYFQHLLSNKNKKRISDSISQICEMEITDLWNGFYRSVTPIPDTYPYPDPNPNCFNNISTTSKKLAVAEKQKSKTKQALTIDDLLKENPHNIPKQVIEDWFEVRKAKRSPVTKTAWSRINIELCKYMGDKIEAFETMVERGWTGFKAEWMTNAENKNNKSQNAVHFDHSCTKWAEPKFTEEFYL